MKSIYAVTEATRSFCYFFLFCDLLPRCFSADRFVPSFARLFSPSMMAAPLPPAAVVLLFMKSSLTIGSMIAPSLVTTLGFVMFFTTVCVFHVDPIGVRMEDSNCAVFWKGNGSWLTCKNNKNNNQSDAVLGFLSVYDWNFCHVSIIPKKVAGSTKTSICFVSILFSISSQNQEFDAFTSERDRSYGFHRTLLLLSYLMRSDWCSSFLWYDDIRQFLVLPWRRWGRFYPKSTETNESLVIW